MPDLKVATLYKNLKYCTHISKVEKESDSFEAYEQSDVKDYNHENIEENDFVESFEMYLTDEMSETQVVELPENFEDSRVNENHEKSQVKILQETKSLSCKMNTNATNIVSTNFKCDFCYRSFKAKKSLKIHQRSHSGEKKFDCNICTKTFSQSSHLKKHEKLHIP